MKPGKRLLIRTVAVLYAALALHIGVSRAFMEEREGDPRAPRRPTPEQLLALQDFSAIDLDGDLSVEVIRRADYSVEILGLDDERGDLYVRVENGTLRISGYGNPDTARIRVGMPALEGLATGYSRLVSINGFSGDSLNLRVSSGETIELRNNDFASLSVVTFDEVELRIDQATLANGVNLNGRSTLIPIEQE